MQQHKIEQYQSEYNRAFPEHIPLNRNQCNEVINQLLTVLPKSDSKKNIFTKVEEAFIGQDYDLDITYDIAYLFSVYQFADEEKLFIIWREDDIDVMNKFSFLNIWESIWQPEEDEAVILFSPTTMKALMITNWGMVYNN